MDGAETRKRKAMICSIVAIGILGVSQVAAQLIASLLEMIGVPAGVCNILAGILYIAGTLLIAKYIFERLFHFDLSELGISKFSLKWKWIIISILLPIAVIAAYVLFIPGEWVSSDLSVKQKFELLSAGIFYIGFGAGFVEEIIFRGAIFHLLKKAWNIKIAVLVPSILFGILHILGMQFSLGSSILVILAGTAVGIMFSMITIESGSVWCSGLVHAMWNAIISGGGLTIAGQPEESSIVTYVLKTNAFAISGGEFGIESSIISLMGYVVVALLALLTIKRRGSINS